MMRGLSAVTRARGFQALSVLVLLACHSPVPTPVDATTDYAVARRQFHTRLIKHPTFASHPYTLPADAFPLDYQSSGLALTAWISHAPDDHPHPAVLFVHGGGGYDVEDWRMSQPFRDAGFIVMSPLLRGENGLPGQYSLFYNEVDDVLAAADVLARQPGVDPGRIYLAGHSAGGTIALLAALTSHRFRAAASFSGDPDFENFAKLPGADAIIPYAPGNPDELRMRSALVFATSFKCPTRMFWGDQEEAVGDANRATVRRARAAGLDVDGIEVKGDHHTMLVPATVAAIAFFAQQRS